MARIRTIKPEFWTSEQELSCSRDARLLFIGLWSFADDNGVNEASYLSAKVRIFPNETCTIEDIKRWISELINAGLLKLYEVEGKSYWHVINWKCLQRIDKPNTRNLHPLPPDIETTEAPINNKQEKFDENSRNIPRTFPEHSENIPGTLATEGKGIEGKGNGKEIYIREAKASPLPIKTPYPEACREIFEYWKKVMNHPKAKLDKHRCSKITQALKNGYTVEDTKKAIDGCSKTSFNMGQNDRNQKYDDIVLIFKDATHIDSFIEKNEAINTITSSSLSPFMQGVC